MRYSFFFLSLPKMAVALLAITMITAIPLLAADGVIEINQAKVLAAGGFPFKITKAGSYRLTSNLDVRIAADPKNTTAIAISADDVTLDLNGFSILGPAVCTGGPPVTSCTNTGNGEGVSLGLQNQLNIVVRNGTVRGMGDIGVSLGGGVVEHVAVVSNGNLGIAVGDGSVSNCVVEFNGGPGIDLSVGNATDNVSNYNGGRGLRVAQGLAAGNKVHRNGGAGILMDSGGLARNNSASANASWGLELGSHAGYLGNVLDGNAGSGGNANVNSGLNLGQNQCGTVACP